MTNEQFNLVEQDLDKINRVLDSIKSLMVWGVVLLVGILGGMMGWFAGAGS